MWQSHIPLVVIVPVGMAKLFSSRFIWSHQTLNLFLHLSFSIWGNYFSNYTQTMKGGSDLQDEGSKRNSLNNHKNTFFSLLPWGSFHCYSPGWPWNLVQSWTSSLSGCTKKIKRLKKNNNSKLHAWIFDTLISFIAFILCILWAEVFLIKENYLSHWLHFCPVFFMFLPSKAWRKYATRQHLKNQPEGHV